MFEKKNKFNKFFSFYFSYFWLKSNFISAKFKHNHMLEFCWTILPTIIVIVLLVPSLKILCSLESLLFFEQPFVTVRVTGNQWYWSYNFFNLNYVEINFDSYMVLESDLKSNSLRLLETDHPLLIPINSPIRFLVTSNDVLHSWAIPSLGVKIDACPGRLNQFLSFLNREGDFYGQCSEICGVNHGFMPINVVGVDLDCLFKSSNDSLF